jgi:hypothetical protein
MKKIMGAFLLFLCFFIGMSVAEANTGDQLIIINKATNRLAFFENGKLVRTFKVATGRSNSYTPEGTFKIVNKIKNRPYYTDNIPGGDPRNPLGDRWLGLDARGTYGTTYAIHGNNNPSSIGTYASAGCVRMYDDEVHWLFDQVNLYTPVVITNSSKSFEAIATGSIGYTSYSKLQSVSVNKKSPQPENTSIAISAQATIKASSFRFQVNDGSKWTTIQDFSASNEISWTPLKAGSYQLKVQVKSKESKKSYDDEKIIPYDIFTPASIQSVEIDQISPQPINTKINITPHTNSNSENVVRLTLFDGEKWTTLQEYSDTSTLTWSPISSGTYKIRVQVKHKLSNNEFDQEKVIDYTIYEPASLTSVTTDIVDPQPIDKQVKLTALSNDDTTNLFQFLIKDGEKWITLQDYSHNKIFSWTPSHAGTYKIKVQTKHSLSNNTFDSQKVFDYTIYEPGTLQGITTFKSNFLPPNSEINISANSKNNKDMEYRFSVFNGTEWEEIQNYSSSNEFQWNPINPGMYKVKIEIKNKLSIEQHDDVRELTYIIYQAIPFVAVLPAPCTLRRKKLVLKKGTSFIRFKYLK